jgi:DNA repair protein RecO (recombination protein O)
MRINLQPAFVLHHRPYRESSMIIDLLTEEQGRITAVARGMKGRFRGILQPFIPLLVSWVGKTELVTLTAAESQGAPIMLQGTCLFSAFYLNELLVRLLHKHDPCASIYALYHNTLIALQSDTLQQKKLRLFEKNLLEQLGYALHLNQEINAEKYYRYIPEQGFKVHEDTQLSSKVFLGKNLLAFQAETFHDLDVLRDAKRLMRLALLPLLGPKPLHTRKLFQEVEKE